MGGKQLGQWALLSSVLTDKNSNVVTPVENQRPLSPTLNVYERTYTKISENRLVSLARLFSNIVWQN